MSEQRVWDEYTREQLRDTLRWVIRGELRLANNAREAILDICREVYIQDDCPEAETEVFLRFAADEFDRAESQLAAEKATWPVETDCDRLDRVEAALRDRGIVLWQVSPCCDTCTRGELTERIDTVDERFPGFRDRLRGYAFFIDQNMPEMLSDGPEISVYLGYGWISPDNIDVPPEVYEKNALAIGHEVCECLRNEGFEPDWDGDLDRKIGVSLCWERRTRHE